MGTGYYDAHGAPLRALCPVCPGRVPMKVEANGLTCPKCRGKVLDRADAEIHLKKFPVPPLPERDPARQRTLGCPLCSGQMTSHRVGDAQVLEICGTCGAVFLPFGGVRQLAMAAAAQPAPQPFVVSRPSRPSGERAVPRPAAPAPAAEPPKGDVALGIARLALRVAPLVALAAAGWWFHEPIGRGLGAIGKGPAVVMASVDMTAPRTALAAEIVQTGRAPADLGAFLRENVSGLAPDKDRWGTPYELRGPPSEPVLASCGPDRECGTDDDLLLTLFKKKKDDEAPPEG